MKTHNVIIYHCLSCGHLVYREPELELPWCCGKKMIQSAAETVFGDEEEAAAEPAGAPCGTAAPALKIWPRPR
jgi:hypothetical protein